MKICAVGAELFHAEGEKDRQLDMMKLTVAFWNFEKEPKKKKLILLMIYDE